MAKLSHTRYCEILPLLLAGMSSADISSKIGCGSSTVSAAAQRARSEGHAITLRKKTRGKAAEQRAPNIAYIRQLRAAESLLITGASIERLTTALSCSDKTARRLMVSLEQLGAVIRETNRDANASIWTMDASTRVFASPVLGWR